METEAGMSQPPPPGRALAAEDIAEYLEIAERHEPEVIGSQLRGQWSLDAMSVELKVA
jgi:hypothetical protein